jgi:soluble lytic murein transglycosylase-like protein
MIAGGAVMVLTIGAFAVSAQYAFSAGERAESMRGVERTKVSAETDEKIMRFVLKRNPDATIRDFQDFPSILLAESRKAGIDFRLIMAQIDKESEFNPRAIGKAGEIGLMQVMPKTGELVAKSLNMPFEYPKGKDLGTLGVPRHNLRIGIKFLKDRMDEFGTIETALRGYNRGPATARENRPGDRYAEDIALKYMMLVNAFERGGPISTIEKPVMPKPVASVLPTLIEREPVRMVAAPVKIKTVAQVKTEPGRYSMLFRATHSDARVVRASYVVGR